METFMNVVVALSAFVSVTIFFRYLFGPPQSYSTVTTYYQCGCRSSKTGTPYR